MYRPERFSFLPSFLPLLLLLTGVPSAAEAQVREVVSSQIAVSRDDATLQLELAPEGSLEIALREGSVTVDGEEIGSYSSGDALDVSWRGLLGEAVALDDGPLARALIEWAPPPEVREDADLAEVGRRLDRTLEDRLSVPAAEDLPANGIEPAEEGPQGPPSELLALLRRADRLAILGEAVGDIELGARPRIAVAEDVVVAEGEEVDGAVIVLDGDLDVRGTVRGDVAVTGGRLRVGEGGRILGDVRLADADLSRDGGEIDGDVTEIPEDRVRLLEDIEALEDIDDLGDLEDLEELESVVDLDALREDLRDRIRDEVRAEMRDDFPREFGGSGFSSPLRSVGRGLGGLVQNVIAFLVVLLLALAVTHLFPRNVALVEEATERAPGRSALVGLAGVFLLLPVYVVGMIVLAISLVGIPVLLVWIPLFPVASVLAGALGYLAVAILLGRWILRQDFQGLDFLRRGNDLHAAAAGLGALLIPYAVANVLLMGGSWLGALHALFTAVGALAGSVALVVGFGAVILTRGGRRPVYAGGPGGPGETPSSAWAPEPEPGPSSPDWGESWEEEWDEDWDQEWEDLEREARRRSGDADGDEDAAGSPEETEGRADETEPEPDESSGGSDETPGTSGPEEGESDPERDGDETRG